MESGSSSEAAQEKPSDFCSARQELRMKNFQAGASSPRSTPSTSLSLLGSSVPPLNIRLDLLTRLQLHRWIYLHPIGADIVQKAIAPIQSIRVATNNKHQLFRPTCSPSLHGESSELLSTMSLYHRPTVGIVAYIPSDSTDLGG